MPREIIHISPESPPFENIALILALIAYPGAEQSDQRADLCRAIVRLAIFQRAEIDEAFAKTPQLIRPTSLTQDEATLNRLLKPAMKMIIRRLIVVKNIVEPHLLGKSNPKVESGLRATVGNSIIDVAEVLGYGVESGKTIEADIWGPAKPVAHIVVAFWRLLLNEMSAEKNTPTSDAFFRLFLQVDPATVVVVSEKLREVIPGIGQFRVREQDTIRLVS